MTGNDKTIPAIITSCRSTNFTMLLIIISYEIILETFHHKAKDSHRVMPSQSILHCYPHISFRAGNVNDDYTNTFIRNYTHRVLISVANTSGFQNTAIITGGTNASSECLRSSIRFNGELLMTPDPILEEVRTIREQLADQFQFDIRRIIEDTQRRQALSNNKIVSFERPKITLHQPDENKTSPS